MNKEQFEQGLEEVTETIKTKVLTAKSDEERSDALNNYKTICDIRYSYLRIDNQNVQETAKIELEGRKIEYTHEENNDRNSNEAEKLWKDARRDEEAQGLKEQQLIDEKKRQKIELAKDVGMFVFKAALLVLTIAGAYQFETGGTWTSSVGKAVIPTLARNAVNDLK